MGGWWVELLLDLPERTGDYTSFRSGFKSIRSENDEERKTQFCLHLGLRV